MQWTVRGFFIACSTADADGLQTEEVMQRWGGAACTEDNVLGRKPSIGLLKKLVEDIGSSSERYEGKHKRSKERSDKILSKLVVFLAPSAKGKKELLQRFAARHGFDVSSDEVELSAATLGRLRLAFEKALSPYERNYVLHFVNDFGYGFTELTRNIFQKSRAK